MSRISSLVVALVCAAVLTACSGPSEGVIRNKQSNPGYYMQNCAPVGKSSVCTPVYIPPTWEFDVWQDSDSHGWVEVSPSTFDEYRVGDYWKGGNR